MERKLIRLGGVRFYSDAVQFYKAADKGVTIWFKDQDTGMLLEGVDIADLDDVLLKIQRPVSIIEFHDAPRKRWFS